MRFVFLRYLHLMAEREKGMISMEEYVMMHWKDLEPHPENPRIDFPADQVEEMARSIEGQGVLQALVCVPLEDGRARIVLGHMRWRGAKALGNKAPELPVRLVDWDEKRQKLAMITENMMRYNLDPIAEARSLAAFRDEMDMTVEEISEMVGLSRIAIQNRLKLLRLPEVPQTLIAEGKLPPSVGNVLLRIKDEDEMMAFALKAAEEGIPYSEIEKASRMLPSRDYTPQNRRKKQRGERHPSSRQPRALIAHEILEEYEGTLEVEQVAKAAEVVCRQCGEDNNTICIHCPLAELLRILVLQPGVEAKSVDFDERRGLAPVGIMVAEGPTPGWKRVV